MRNFDDSIRERVNEANKSTRFSFIEKFGSSVLDEDDSTRDDDEWEVEDVEPFSMVMDIEYRKSAKQTVPRRIRLIRVAESGNDVTIWSWCYLRDAYRTFKLSKIVSVVDIVTGEVFDDAHAYFAECGILTPASNEAAAIKRCMNDLIVLSFLGVCDGKFLPIEEDAILHHVLERVDIQLDENEVRRRISAIAPDERAYERAIKALEHDDEGRRALVRSVRRVIDADGTAHENEIMVGAEILKALGVSMAA